MGPGFAILHHQIGLCLADKTVNEKGSRPLYFPLTARTPRPWTTGTGSAMPIGGPRTARSWPTKARAAIWSRRTPTRTSRSGPSSGPTTPRTAASFFASPIQKPSAPRARTRRISTINAQTRSTAPGCPQCGRGISDAQSRRQWNNYEITAKGSHLTIVFNGSKTVDIQHAQFTEGPISLQFANREKGTPGGAIKWRKVQIRPL